VIGGTGAQPARFLAEPKRERQKMPLLLYFPLIIWMGMTEVMQQQMQAVATIKPRAPYSPLS